jgi:hypothetical protein
MNSDAEAYGNPGFVKSLSGLIIALEFAETIINQMPDTLGDLEDVEMKVKEALLLCFRIRLHTQIHLEGDTDT